MEDATDSSATAKIEALVAATAELNQTLDKFNIGGADVSGNARQGFIINSTGSGTAAFIGPSSNATAVIDTSPAPPIPAAEPFDLRITLTGVTGHGTPTGNVQLSIGSYTSPVTALSGGVAIWTVPGQVPRGFYTATVTYSGDTTYRPNSYSAGLDIHSTPTITFAYSPDPPQPHETFTITLTVVDTLGMGPTPTGLARVIFNGLVGSWQTLDGSGQIVEFIFNQPPETVTIEGDYQGDGIYIPDTEFTFLTINPVDAGILLSVIPGGTSLFSCDVSATGGSPTPTGTVELFVNGVSEGVVTLDSGGSAAYIVTLSPGSYSAFYNYSGDSEYNPGVSNTVFFTVL